MDHESEFIEKYAKKIYELCPYSEEVYPSYETRIIPWEEVYTSKDKYIDLVKEIINELNYEFAKSLPEEQKQIWKDNLNKW